MSIKIDHRSIGQDYMPYYIAEACNNHGSNVPIAIEMVKAAHEIGADAIKFQLRFGENYLKSEDYRAIYDFACREGITCFFTVFDDEGIDFVRQVTPSAVKIGSAEWTQFAFVKKVLALGLPTIISTGGGHQEHIDYVMRLIRGSTNPNVALLHCTSIYPCPSKYAGLNLITQYLAYGIPVGYSDHTLGIHMPCGATALGASIIEKHFTLDPSIGGPDQELSLTPRQFEEMMNVCDWVWEGSRPTRKTYLKQEEEKLKRWRDKSALS